MNEKEKTQTEISTLKANDQNSHTNIRHRANEIRIESSKHTLAQPKKGEWNNPTETDEIAHLPRPIFNSSTPILNLIVVFSVAAAAWAVIIFIVIVGITVARVHLQKLGVRERESH